jgi:hypothetical protein
MVCTNSPDPMILNFSPNYSYEERKDAYDTYH